ncbi:kinase-like protein, partial [Macrolepiota fuliginosa MF-IS2]
RKYALVTLYKLSRASMLYPRCYVLKGITIDSPEAGGGFCDIHKGSYGEQYLCLKVVRVFRKTETTVMLKIFAKEAILWGQLYHPNILPFYGVYYLDEACKRICLVSPWMDNGNLAEYLRGNPTTPRRLFMYDIINGLSYLHDKSIVHGDLKAANVLVNEIGRACITDFGLSRLLTEKTFAITNATSSMGGFSSRWTAPELLEAPQASRAGDIWAFGSVCYEISTRLLPFHDCQVESQVIRRLLAGDLPTRPQGDPITDMDKIDDEIWDLMNRCWAQQPDDRPSCLQILHQLSQGTVPDSSYIAQDRLAREMEHFQHTMTKSSDISIDLAQVEQILNGVRIAQLLELYLVSTSLC